MTETEFAGARHSSLNAYRSLADRSGRPVNEIVALAEENRLGELFVDGRLKSPGPVCPHRGEDIGQTLSGDQALRLIEARRDGSKPLSPGAARVILRSYMSRWDREIAERAQRGLAETQRRLAQLLAKRDW